MKFLLPLLLLMLVSPFCALAEAGNSSIPATGSSSMQEPLRLAFFTDLHYIAPSLTDHGEAFMHVIENADGKVTQYCDIILDAFIEDVLTRPVNAVILQGDLTFNGEPDSHEALAEKLSRIRESGIPVYVIPGNHDVYNSNAARYEGARAERIPWATTESFRSVWHAFGLDTAIAIDSASLSYTVDLPGDFRLLMVDCNTETHIGVLKEETLAFVEGQLKQAAADGKQVIAVSHQTVLVHNPLFTSGFQMENADALAALYRKYGVICNVCGHMHIQHIAGEDTGFPEIVISSASVSPCQYGLLTLESGGMEFHTVKIPVSHYAASIGETNPDLLNFDQFAAAFFVKGSLRQASSLFPDLDIAARNRLLSYLASLNSAYFAGNLTGFSIKDPDYLRLAGSSGFWSIYARSMHQDLSRKYTTFHYTY